MRLVEVFREFQLILPSYSRSEEYRVNREIIEIADKSTIAKEILEELAKNLADKSIITRETLEELSKKLAEKFTHKPTIAKEILEELTKNLAEKSTITRETLEELSKNLAEKFPHRSILTREILEEYAKNLAERFPERGFKVYEKKHKGKVYIVLDQDTKTKEGKIKKDRIPIFFDLENQKAYIPYSFTKKRKKRARYIVFRTLGILGWARVGRIIR